MAAAGVQGSDAFSFPQVSGQQSGSPRAFGAKAATAAAAARTSHTPHTPSASQQQQQQPAVGGPTATAAPTGSNASAASQPAPQQAAAATSVSAAVSGKQPAASPGAGGRVPAQPPAADKVAADRARLVALQIQHTRLEMANEAMTMAETSARLGKMAHNAMFGGGRGGGNGSGDGGVAGSASVSNDGVTTTIGVSGGSSGDTGSGNGASNGDATSTIDVSGGISGSDASSQTDICAPQDPGSSAADDPWAAYSGGSTADIYAAPSADIYAPAADVTASPQDALYFPPAPSYADYAAQSVSADPYAASIDPSSLPAADASQCDIYVPSAADGYGVYDDSAFQPAGLEGFDYGTSVQAAAATSGGGAEYCPGDTRADEDFGTADASGAADAYADTYADGDTEAYDGGGNTGCDDAIDGDIAVDDCAIDPGDDGGLTVTEQYTIEQDTYVGADGSTAVVTDEQYNVTVDDGIGGDAAGADDEDFGGGDDLGGGEDFSFDDGGGFDVGSAFDF